jgi:hypothetical protein
LAATQDQALALEKSDQANKQAAVDETKPFLNQFYGGGDTTKTPFYHALLSAGTEGTSRAYANAKAGLRRNSVTSGFGYGQPVAEGADRELASREASDMSVIPRDSLIKADDMGMKAAALRTNQGGMFNPQADLNISAQIGENIANRESNAAGAFGGGIAQTVAGLADIFKKKKQNANTGYGGGPIGMSTDDLNQVFLGGNG